MVEIEAISKALIGTNQIIKILSKSDDKNKEVFPGRDIHVCNPEILIKIKLSNLS